MVKTVIVWRDKHDESMDRLYMDDFDERRERKAINFSKSWDHNHEDDKCRRHSSQDLWIASGNSMGDL
jgi:hypothetical protein